MAARKSIKRSTKNPAAEPAVVPPSPAPASAANVAPPAPVLEQLERQPDPNAPCGARPYPCALGGWSSHP